MFSPYTTVSGDFISSYEIIKYSSSSEFLTRISVVVAGVEITIGLTACQVARGSVSSFTPAIAIFRCKCFSQPVAFLDENMIQ